MNIRRALPLVPALLFVVKLAGPAAAFEGVLPDGRVVSPVGFTIPVESFASAEAISPDGSRLAVLSQDGSAIDIIEIGDDHRAQIDRLPVPGATGMVWTTDGLYVCRGYAGLVSRFSYGEAADGSVAFTRRAEVKLGGLLNGIAEDPATHRFLVARTAAQEIDMVDDQNGTVVARMKATGQPYGVVLAGQTVLASIYNSDHLDAWRMPSASAAPADAEAPTSLQTGPHPTAMLVNGDQVFVANADGHTVSVVDANALTVSRTIDLSYRMNPPPGQTPSGLALSGDGKWLFVCESGYNDVAVVDLHSAKVAGRIPTAWYPMQVLFAGGSTIDKDPRKKPQLWIVSAKGLGPQPNPGGEWDGTYTGLVQHVVVEPHLFAHWSDVVRRNDRAMMSAPAQPLRAQLPSVKHVIFIVRENKHFDEEFGDEPTANADPALLLYGRKYTPNLHALAERYALFDNFMGDGEASIFGHAWVTQGMTNDYHERNAHTEEALAAATDPHVATSIWPYSLYGEDSVPFAVMDFDWFKDLLSLPSQPRINVSGVFGPRGELIDELQRHGVSFRVYGEQMTMTADGRIAPGLAAHALTDYPGAHIDYGILDTERARLFLNDVAAHGLAAYSFLTLPTDHTAGRKAGFYTPASYVASNDLAIGQIIAGLSRRAEWSSTVVFITTDDAQGTGDHVDSHRMPMQATGPLVRAGFVDHTRYSIPSVLRTVEVLFGLDALNIYDAEATPMFNALQRQPRAARYTALPMNIPIEKNPGQPKTTSFALDAPDSTIIPDQEWASIKGERSLAAHRAYLAQRELTPVAATQDPDDR